MNLRNLVRGAIKQVNPDTIVSWYQSGSAQPPTVQADGSVYPVYNPATSGAPTLCNCQVQPLSGEDLQQIAGLNLQGLLRSVHAFGSINGIVRPQFQGGDVLMFLDPATNVASFPQTQIGTPALQFNPSQWLVVKVLETWGDGGGNTGWCRVVVQLQQS